MKHQLQKVQNLRTDEVYYTYSDWPPKFIDGKKFIPVSRDPVIPAPRGKEKPIFFLNIDSLKITDHITKDSKSAS